MKKTILVLLLCLGSIFAASAQRVALKNNLAYDLSATPNLALEVGMSPKWTFDLQAGWNPFQIAKDNVKWKHWLVQPEFRYWFCERFNGWFLGGHLLGGQMNFGGVKWPPIAYMQNSNLFGSNSQIKGADGAWTNGQDKTPFKDIEKYRYQGWYAGAGLSVGYQWILSNRWNLEASIGGGWVHLFYDKAHAPKCGSLVSRNQEADYFGITKATISIVYLFR